MNQLKTAYNGGWALELDDLDFLNAAVREAFYGLLSGFGIAPVDSFIISGCDQSGANYNPGFISLNGEILKVDGGVLPVPGVGEVLYWDVDISYPTAGREQLETGASVDTYEVRKAVVLKAVLAPGTYMPFAAVTIKQLLAKFAIQELPFVLESYHEVGDPGTGLGTAYLGSPAWRRHTSSPLRFWKDPFGYVRIEGWVGVGAGGNIFQLPVGYRPATPGLFAITKKVSVNVAGTIANRLFIDASGAVYVNGADNYDGAEELSLDGVIFKGA